MHQKSCHIFPLKVATILCSGSRKNRNDPPFIKNISLIVLDKTYLQKPNCVMIENISSNKMKPQLRFILKNKDMKSKVRRINLK